MKPYTLNAAACSAIAMLAAACSAPKPTELVPVELQTVASIDQISDTTFFSDSWMMKYDDGYIYSLDSKQMRVIRFDDDLHFSNFIGTNGRANNEIAMAHSMDIHDDTVAVYDSSGKMKYFSTDGEYLGNQEFGEHTPADFFIIQDGYTYFPTTNVDESAFACISADGCIPFGAMNQEDDNPGLLPFKNKRFMHVHNGKIIAVAQFYPFIEVYDKESLQLEQRIAYDDIPLVEQNILASQQIQGNSDFIAITPVIRDCCFHDNRMYMSVPDRDNGKYNCNKVIAFDIGKTIRPVALYVLGDSSYGTICADDDYIYAFDSKNTAMCKIALP